MSPHSGELNRTVVIAVIAVRMMKVAVDQIVDVITMRYRFVSAARPVDMARIMGATVMVGCTLVRVLCADLKPVLVYMIGMRMMQVPVMEVIDVIAMFDGRVPAVRAVLMVVVGMMGSLQVLICKLLVSPGIASWMAVQVGLAMKNALTTIDRRVVHSPAGDVPGVFHELRPWRARGVARSLVSGAV